jgi:glutathione S-transferase
MHALRAEETRIRVVVRSSRPSVGSLADDCHFVAWGSRMQRRARKGCTRAQIETREPLPRAGDGGTFPGMDVLLNVERLWISPYVFSCFVSLTEKGIGFRVAELDTNTGDTRSDAYLKRTLTGRVPSLEHGDFALSESSAIVEYLDQVFPDPPVLPRDAHERARCRQILSWLRSDALAPLREARPTSSMFYEHITAPLEGAAKLAADQLIAVSERLLAHGHAHAHAHANLFGMWSIADSELAFMLHRLILNQQPVPTRVRDYAVAQWQRPSVQQFVQKKRPPRA